MRSLKALLILSLAACGGGEADNGNPVSSADAGGGGVSFGGAQDIGEFRGILNRGEIPGSSTLDANGFFNEHYNAPPQLTCTGLLCLSPGLSVGKDWLTGGYQAALQLSVNTNVDPAQYTRLPMDLVVVVDHSGSMSQDQRLEKVKQGLHTLIDNVKDEDRVAIISFDDVVTFDAPFTATLDRAHLHQVVNALQPRGGTNIFDGLKSGFGMINESPNVKQNRVIFLSDGLATVGNTSQSSIISMATGFISQGIGLTTVGVGNDFDVQLMRGLAERGAGNFYYVENAAAATEVFTEELKYFLSPLALDIHIEARTNANDWEMKSVVGSTLWTAGPSLGKMDVPAVFLASRTDQNPDPTTGGRRGGGSMIFIQLTPHTNVAGKVADLTLSYRTPNSTERITQTITLDYMRPPQEINDPPYLSYPEMSERYAMYNMFLGFRLATDYAAYNYNCAMAVLTQLRTTAATWGERYASDTDIAADLVLVDKFVTNLRTKGATESTLATCPNSGNPYPGGDGGWGDDVQNPPHYRAACSASNKPSWLALLGVILIVVRRRRR